MTLISASHFYENYLGHKIDHLRRVLHHIKPTGPDATVVYLAGDSTLDNKFYVLNISKEDAVNGYEKVLSPSKCIQDLTYHFNKLIYDSGLSNIAVINCAVEEATLGSKQKSLNIQDRFIQDNITNNDVLIVSCGGNDLALNPSIKTMWNLFTLTRFNSKESIKKKLDSYYYEEAGLPSSKSDKSLWGVQHFIKLFRDDMKSYIKSLIKNRKPSKVIVCSIYYPDKKAIASWANVALDKLDYNNDPEKLQLIIQYIHREAISKITIKGVTVVPFPLYEVLNGDNSNDYVARVEPSVLGGYKIASAFFKHLID
jgi:hypothetical protein